MRLQVAAAPFNVALLCQNRYAWWLTTLVETLVLTQWLYHLAKLCATTGALHRWVSALRIHPAGCL